MYRLLTAVGLFVTGLLFAACGGGEEEAPSSPTTSQASITTAVLAADPEKLVEDRLSGESIREKLCLYYARQELVDCGTDGVYRLSDGVTGESPHCHLILDQSGPVAIRCVTQAADEAVLYVIER